MWPSNNLPPEHDLHVQDWIRQYTSNGDVFYDIGANTGMMSKVAMDSGALVIAFKPVPSACVEIGKFLHYPHKIINCAVWSESCLLPMRLYPESGQSEIGDRADSPIEFYTAAMALKDMHLPKPTILKSDAQGAEVHILKGCLENGKDIVLNDCKVMILEFYGPGIAELGTLKKEFWDLTKYLGFVQIDKIGRDVLFVRQ